MKSIWKAMSLGTAGRPKGDPSSLVSPNGMPAMVIATITMMKLPGTFLALSAMSTTTPARVTNAAGELRSPSSSELLPVVVRPAERNPTKVMKIPIAGPIASRMDVGMIRVIRFRIPKIVSSRKMTPDQNTMPIAVGYGTFPSRMSV